jgi:hypothetical protein
MTDEVSLEGIGLALRMRGYRANVRSRPKLLLERDAVGTLSGHGFHPLKAQLTLSNH